MFRRISLTAILGLAAAGLPVAPSVAGDSGGAAVSPVSRTTVFVRDLEEAKKLYVGILGLQVRIDRQLEGDWWNDLMGTRQASVHVLVLHSGRTEPVGDVALFQFADPGVTPTPSRSPRLETGDVALVMSTPDIQSLYRKVRDAGYVVISPPKAGPVRAGWKGPFWEMLFRDRDGIVVNLVEAPEPDTAR